MKKKFLVLGFATILSASLLAGCGSNHSDYYESASDYDNYATGSSAKSTYYDYSDDAYDYDVADYEEAAEYDEGYSEEASSSQAESVNESAQSSKRKLIRNVSMDVETEDFDTLISNLEKKTTALGGYIEQSNVYNGSATNTKNRTANLTIRIPSGELDNFISNVADQSNITNKSESVSDVTLQYVDIKAHKESLEVEQKRLSELLEEASDVEEIIYIEERMTQVRYEIESMESQLRTYDNLVDYSTINMSVQEVKKYTPVTEEKSRFRQAIEGFGDSMFYVFEDLLDFIVGLFAAIPYLVVIGAIFYGIYRIIKKIVVSIIDAKKYKGLTLKEKSVLKKQEKEEKKRQKKEYKEYKKQERRNKKNKTTSTAATTENAETPVETPVEAQAEEAKTEE